MVRWKLWPHSDEEYLKYDESHSVCFSCWGSCLKLQRVIWIQTQKAPWSFLSLDQSGGVMDQATGDRAMLPSKTPHHQLLKMLSCCTEALWAFSVDCCHSGNCAVVTIILSREGRLKKSKLWVLILKIGTGKASDFHSSVTQLRQCFTVWVYVCVIWQGFFNIDPPTSLETMMPHTLGG